MSRLFTRSLVVALTLSIVSLTSVALHGAIQWDFLITGLICSLIVEEIVSRISRRHPRSPRGAELRLEDRARVEEQLITAERMVTAGNAASGVCHEIQNSLAALLGGLELAQELLAEGDPPEGEIEGILEDAIAAARQVAVVTADLQRLARRSSDPIGPVDVEAVVQAAIRLAATHLRRQCVVTVEIPPDLPRVQGSASLLIQVLLNLLNNAASASRAEEQNPIRIRALAVGGGSVAIEVQDSGVGMNEEIRDRLFEPLFTTRGASGSSGLGLYLCRSIVTAHGGEIAVRSTPEGGSTFTLTLPGARPPAG